MPSTELYGTSFTIPEELHVDALSAEGNLVTIHASTETPEARCPLCEQPSRRTHGYYTRTLADLPWCGTPVRLRVRVRKFFCDEPSCERRIFAERLEEVAPVHARGTDRRREALEWIAFALGGEAGARLARELGLLVSPDTLLNRIRGALRTDAEEVRVLGVDDFGFRKGNVPGTVLVDLERHKIADLFEGHSAESIAQGLRRHPGLEVVSRDRSPVCREAINDGAPHARQVADRWHLLHNLAQVLEEFLLQKRPALRDAVFETEAAESEEGGGFPDQRGPERPGSWRAQKEEAARRRHERLVEQWKDIRRLHLAGANVRFISRRLEGVMNFSSAALAFGHGYKKTIPKRRFRRRMALRGSVPGSRARGCTPTRVRPARGLQRTEVGGENRLLEWRYMPHDLPPWEAIYQQTQRWIKARVFEDIVHDLRALLRLSEGRTSDPSAAILGGRTLRSTPESGHRAGYDGHKGKKGSKVHAAVDTLGHLLALLVSSPANEQERAYVGELADRVQEATGESVEISFVDQGYTGERPSEEAEAHGITLEVVKHEEARLCALAEEMGCGTRFRVGIAFSAVGEGLREAAGDFGGAAFCRVCLPLSPAGGRHSQCEFITL
jgi:transposase